MIHLFFWGRKNDLEKMVDLGSAQIDLDGIAQRTDKWLQTYKAIFRLHTILYLQITPASETSTFRKEISDGTIKSINGGLWGYRLYPNFAGHDFFSTQEYNDYFHRNLGLSQPSCILI